MGPKPQGIAVIRRRGIYFSRVPDSQMSTRSGRNQLHGKFASLGSTLVPQALLVSGAGTSLSHLTSEENDHFATQASLL